MIFLGELDSRRGGFGVSKGRKGRRLRPRWGWEPDRSEGCQEREREVGSASGLGQVCDGGAVGQAEAPWLRVFEVKGQDEVVEVV